MAVGALCQLMTKTESHLFLMSALLMGKTSSTCTVELVL